MRRGTFVSHAEAERTTLAEALDRYRREVTPAKKGASIERFRLDRWAAHDYAQRSLASIRGKDIADYIEEKGLNPMEVAAITGHKTLQMLKRYTHLRAEDLVGRLG